MEGMFVVTRDVQQEILPAISRKAETSFSMFRRPQVYAKTTHVEMASNAFPLEYRTVVTIAMMGETTFHSTKNVQLALLVAAVQRPTPST